MIYLYLRNNKIKMKQSQIKYLIIALSITAFSNVNSQTCGFGCLGLSGVFGGYSLQQFEADGLNQHLNLFLPSSSDAKFNFNEARGFKVGINLFRADYSNFFFTFKGYYQFLSQDQNIKTPLYSGNDEIYEFYDTKLEMNNWGIGLDFGIPLFSFIDWKVVEGELKFFSPKLTQKIYNNDPLGNSISIENKYTPDKVQMGFSIGSGLIFNIIEDYVSLEATGMYTFLEIDHLTNDLDGTSIPNLDSGAKFISKGGFQAFVQLNIGIPL